MVARLSQSLRSRIAFGSQVGMNANQPEKLLPPADRNKLVADFGIPSLQVSAAAFVILTLSGFPAPCVGATVHHSDGSLADVRAAINQSQDGDTVTLPAGTFSWTSGLDITKGITLQGETTITGAGTETVAGRKMNVLNLVPKKQNNVFTRAKVWIDASAIWLS